jgi:hypothetical protein
VASADLKGLGSNEGEPVYYFWNPLCNLIGLVSWLILLAAFVLFRENRRRQALWMMVPVLVIYIALKAYLKFSNPFSVETTIFLGLYETLVLGFAVIWLLAERIGGRNRFLTWLAALAVFLLFIGVSLSTLTSVFERIIMSVSQGMSVGIALIAISLAAVMSRKRFGPVRFCVWVAVWLLIITPLLLLAAAAIQIRDVSGTFDNLIPILKTSLIFAGVIIAGLLPFEILLFVNRFWRKRFDKVIGISTSREVFSAEPPAPPISTIE